MIELEYLDITDVSVGCSFLFALISVTGVIVCRESLSIDDDKCFEIFFGGGAICTAVFVVISSIIKGLLELSNDVYIGLTFILLLLLFLIIPIITWEDEDINQRFFVRFIEGVLSVIVVIMAINLAFYFSLSDSNTEVKTPSPAIGELRSDLMNHIEANYPLLAQKWIHVNKQIAKCEEYKRQLNSAKEELDAAALAEYSVKQVPDAYFRIVSRLETEIMKLVNLKNEYESFFERSYAEKMVRNIDSDEELKKDVERLIKSTDLILSENKTYVETKENLNKQ